MPFDVHWWFLPEATAAAPAFPTRSDPSASSSSSQPLPLPPVGRGEEEGQVSTAVSAEQRQQQQEQQEAGASSTSASASSAAKVHPKETASGTATSITETAVTSSAAEVHPKTTSGTATSITETAVAVTAEASETRANKTVTMEERDGKDTKEEHGGPNHAPPIPHLNAQGHYHPSNDDTAVVDLTDLIDSEDDDKDGKGQDGKNEDDGDDRGSAGDVRSTPAAVALEAAAAAAAAAAAGVNEEQKQIVKTALDLLLQNRCVGVGADSNGPPATRSLGKTCSPTEDSYDSEDDFEATLVEWCKKEAGEGKRKQGDGPSAPSTSLKTSSPPAPQGSSRPEGHPDVEDADEDFDATSKSDARANDMSRGMHVPTSAGAGNVATTVLSVYAPKNTHPSKLAPTTFVPPTNHENVTFPVRATFSTSPSQAYADSDFSTADVVGPAAENGVRNDCIRRTEDDLGAREHHFNATSTGTHSPSASRDTVTARDNAAPTSPDANTYGLSKTSFDDLNGVNVESITESDMTKTVFHMTSNKQRADAKIPSQVQLNSGLLDAAMALRNEDIPHRRRSNPARFLKRKMGALYNSAASSIRKVGGAIPVKHSIINRGSAKLSPLEIAAATASCTDEQLQATEVTTDRPTKKPKIGDTDLSIKPAPRIDGREDGQDTDSEDGPVLGSNYIASIEETFLDSPTGTKAAASTSSDALVQSRGRVIPIISVGGLKPAQVEESKSQEHTNAIPSDIQDIDQKETLENNARVFDNGSEDINLEEEDEDHSIEPFIENESVVFEELVSEEHGLIDISVGKLALASSPLLAIACIFWKIGMISISTSIIEVWARASIQLACLGSILVPIFRHGSSRPILIAGYALFMIVMAAWEASSRMKYTFDGQFYVILSSLLFNIVWVGLLAFVGIIKPAPIWNPRYVLPIIGMLLGNSISCISLSMDSITASFLEDQPEIELYLSFGATKYEAMARLWFQALHKGATPTLNMMRVVGVLSIPGMMTGQILGGSPAFVAAKYQMLILILIALCTLSTILINTAASIEIAFCAKQLLRPETFVKNNKKSILGLVVWLWGVIASGGISDGLSFMLARNAPASVIMGSMESATSIPGLHVDYLKKDTNGGQVLVKASNLIRSFPIATSIDGSFSRVLFQNLTFEVSAGDIIHIDGRSGAGKSQLLRMIGGLSPLEGPGEIKLLASVDDDDDDDDDTEDNHHQHGSTFWRKDIRYVPQHKIQIPGTPMQLIKRIEAFSVWKDDEIRMDDLVSYLDQWGLDAKDCLNKEWSVLSGGEAQRVMIALALASHPSVVLFDESTASLDKSSKMAIEESVDSYRKEFGSSVIWVSHDEHQNERMSS